MDDETSEIWTDERLDAIVDHVEGAYPEEGCGLVLEDEAGEYRVKPTENLADQYHEMDPEQYPRGAEEFYVIDPREFMEAERRDERVALVFHSHADVGDYFSDDDVDAATLPRSDEDEPLQEAHPGTDWLVVSVRDGEADHATLFRFDEGSEGEPFPAVMEIAIDDGNYRCTDAGR